MRTSPTLSRVLVPAFAAFTLTNVCTAQSASLTSADRSIEVNQMVHSTTEFGAWSDTVTVALTNCTQTSDIQGNLFSVSGSLHAHWPAGNSANTGYTAGFTLAYPMSYSLGGTMSAFVTSFGFSGPGWSTLTLTGPSGTVFSHVITGFTSTPSVIELTGGGLLEPGDYTLHFDAFGQGFGSSLMTSGVSDASWNVTLTLDGLCGTAGEGSCYVEHEEPSCSDLLCCSLVCWLDPFCCDTEWDSLCVSEAESECGAPCLADLDANGTVDAADLAVLLGAWGTSDPADFDSDGIVGGSDLAILLGAWGGC